MLLGTVWGLFFACTSCKALFSSPQDPEDIPVSLSTTTTTTPTPTPYPFDWQLRIDSLMDKSIIQVHENTMFSYFRGPDFVPITSGKRDSLKRRLPYIKPKTPQWRQKLEDEGHRLKDQGLWIAYPPSVNFDGYRYMRSAPFTAYNANGDTVLHYPKDCPYSLRIDGGEEYLMLTIYPNDFAAANPVLNGFYGFLTEDGRIAIPPQFPVGRSSSYPRERFSAYHPSDFLFQEGRALVEEGRLQYYFINQQGKRTFPFDSTFYRARPFEKGGLTIVQHLPSKRKLIDQVIDTTGQVVWDTKGHPEWQTFIGITGTGRGQPYFIVSDHVGTAVKFMDSKQRKSALFPSSNDSVRYFTRIAPMGSLGQDQERLGKDLLMTIERKYWYPKTEIEKRAIQIRGFDGTIYTDWIPLPAGASVDPYTGILYNLPYSDKGAEARTLDGTIVYQCDSCEIEAAYKRGGSFPISTGFFTVRWRGQRQIQNVFTYKGKVLTKRKDRAINSIFIDRVREEKVDEYVRLSDDFQFQFPEDTLDKYYRDFYRSNQD
ncbi:MAG: hypothetical protein AAFU33_09175 [Bacteroidota bacterium]